MLGGSWETGCVVWGVMPGEVWARGSGDVPAAVLAGWERVAVLAGNLDRQSHHGRWPCSKTGNRFTYETSPFKNTLSGYDNIVQNALYSGYVNA